MIVGGLIEFQLPKVGAIKMRHITAGDLVSINALYQDENLDGRAKVAAILSRQLISPVFSDMKISKLSGSIVDNWAVKFATLDNSMSRHFNPDGDTIAQFLSAIDKIHTHMIELMQRITKDAKASLDRVNRLFNPIVESNRNISDEFNRGIVEIIQPIIQQRSAIFNSFHKVWERSDIKYRSDLKTIKPYLKKYKWFISPSMPVSAIHNIANAIKRGSVSRKDLTDCFVDYFSKDDWKNTEEMVMEWDTGAFNVARLRVIRNCVSVLRIDKQRGVNVCYAVLPALISQIDGAILDYLEANLPIHSKVVSNQKTSRKKPPKVRKYLGGILPQSPYHDLDELVRYVLLDILYQNSWKDEPLSIAFNFNRHKIMHGEIANYGRKDYVVRSLMILDSLAHF